MHLPSLNEHCQIVEPRVFLGLHAIMVATSDGCVYVMMPR